MASIFLGREKPAKDIGKRTKRIFLLCYGIIILLCLVSGTILSISVAVHEGKTSGWDGLGVIPFGIGLLSLCIVSFVLPGTLAFSSIALPEELVFGAGRKDIPLRRYISKYILLSFLSMIIFYTVLVLLSVVTTLPEGENLIEIWYAGAFAEEYVSVAPSQAVYVVLMYLYGNLVVACAHWGIYVLWGCLLGVFFMGVKKLCGAAALSERGCFSWKKVLYALSMGFCALACFALVGAMILSFVPTVLVSLAYSADGFIVGSKTNVLIPLICLSVGVGLWLLCFLSFNKRTGTENGKQ